MPDAKANNEEKQRTEWTIEELKKQKQLDEEKQREIIKEKKANSVKILHLTMYGENINEVASLLQKEEKILIIVGAEKVPREIYDFADYNIAIGNQPHSEISEIIPTKRGKNVIIKETMDK